jgi:hypothetical protein
MRQTNNLSLLRFARNDRLFAWAQDAEKLTLFQCVNIFGSWV